MFSLQCLAAAVACRAGDAFTSTISHRAVKVLRTNQSTYAMLYDIVHLPTCNMRTSCNMAECNLDVIHAPYLIARYDSCSQLLAESVLCALTQMDLLDPFRYILRQITPSPSTTVHLNATVMHCGKPDFIDAWVEYLERATRQGRFIGTWLSAYPPDIIRNGYHLAIIMLGIVAPPKSIDPKG